MRDVFNTGGPDASRLIFRLADNRRVWLAQFRSEHTYDHLLEGRPTPETNRRLVARALQAASEHFEAPAVLVGQDGPGVSTQLPPVRCGALLVSTPLTCSAWRGAV